MPAKTDNEAKGLKTGRKGALTKVIAIVGTLLTWFPILAPVLLYVVGIFAKPRVFEDLGPNGELIMMKQNIFWFDWLMPAELFPLVVAGGALLIWASLRAHSRQKIIIWSYVILVSVLVIGQVFAVVTGLASGEIEASGSAWFFVIGSIVIYCLGVISAGVGGILLLKDLFMTSRRSEN